MPFPSELNVAFTPAEIAAIEGAFATIKSTITGKATVNLTPQERQQGPSVDNIRLPYVQKTISELSANYPTLVPGFQDPAKAINNLQCAVECRNFTTLAQEALEIITDFSIANERLAYQYTLDFYENAKRADTRNVPGAGTAVDELKPLFEQETNPENEEEENPENPENP